MTVCDMIIPCPVCQSPMKRTGNPKIHCCPSRKINFPTLNQSLDISHASIYLNDLGEKIYVKIISAEYSFEIYMMDDDQPSTHKTVIKKLQHIDRSTWEQSIDSQPEFVELLTVYAAIDLPWNNHSKIRETVKTYLLFS